MPSPAAREPDRPSTLSALAAIDLQDALLTACTDLERLQRLLAGTCADLSAGFNEAIERIARHRSEGSDPAALLLELDASLTRSITALQFEDMASQLIAHTRGRLRHGADRLALAALADDEDGEGLVEPGPLRPNPVTQDEMDAGSVELF